MMRLLLSLLLLCPILAWSVTSEFEFGDKVNEARYISYIAKVRCLVCQNESLGSSRAELAIDLRNRIYQMMAEEKTDQQISTFLVERYGDFILYQPPLKNSTLLLWLGPFVLLASLIFLLINRVRKLKHNDNTLTTEQQELAVKLLSTTKESDQ